MKNTEMLNKIDNILKVLEHTRGNGNTSSIVNGLVNNESGTLVCNSSLNARNLNKKHNISTAHVDTSGNIEYLFYKNQAKYSPYMEPEMVINRALVFDGSLVHSLLNEIKSVLENNLKAVEVLK